MITEHKSYMIGEAPKKRHLLHVTCAPCSPRPSLCSAEKQKKIMPGGGGYSSEFLLGGGGWGWGVSPCPPNSDPIFDQNM